MSTLLAAPLAPLLDRLFAESDAAEAATDSLVASLPGAEVRRLMASKTEYGTLYGLLRDQPLAVSRETGALLHMLARSTGARTVVEFGTSFGLSTLFLAAALRDNGGGRVVTTEFEPAKAARARANFAEAGLADLVELREGDALETLAAGLPESVDLLVLDGAKALYPEVLALVEPRLRPGALVVADDAAKSPDCLARLRAPSAGYLSVPFGPDVELSMRLG